MSKPKDNRKAVFTVLGEIKIEGGKKRLAINSPETYMHQLQQFPVGRKLGITIEEYKAARSSQQLAYHWVLMGYLSRETGYTSEEIHDVIMRRKFGTKEVTIGGITDRVRKSVSDSARFPKSDMVELITFDLELCAELGIRVPTKEELGYISNT